jgi:ABC-type bacteriocin/lantibiotic exporter with double-glycine peptidase domain
MLHKLRDMFQITGLWSRFVYLLLLRSPFDAARTITQAYFLQYSFHAIEQKDMKALYLSCTIFGIGSLLLFLYNGTIWVAFSSNSIRIIKILREKIFIHISGISLKEMESKSTGEWITRLNTDVWQACSVINQPLQLPHAVVASVGIFVSAIFIITRNPFFFLLILLFIIPHLIMSQKLIAKPITKFNEKAQEITAKNTFIMNAMITCADTAILYDAKDLLMKQFEESSLELRNANMRIRKRNALNSGLLPIMGLGGYLTLLFIGSTWIINGAMTFGELTAIFQYRGGVLVGAAMLTNCFISMKQSQAGINRVLDTFNIQVEE